MNQSSDMTANVLHSQSKGFLLFILGVPVFRIHEENAENIK